MKFLAVDLGNVVCDVNFSSFIKALSKSLNVSSDDVNYFLNRTQKLHDLGLTVISDELRDHFKIKSSVIIDELMIEWNKTIKAHPFMISTLKDLIHKDNVKVALLSNIGMEHSSMMREILTKDVYDYSIKFFSCRTGCRKPTHLYYKTFLDMYPDFTGCVYLDDRIENVEAGKDFKFDAHHFVLDSFNSIPELADRVALIKENII